MHLRHCRLHLNLDRKPNPNPYTTLLTQKLLEPGVVSLPNSVYRPMFAGCSLARSFYLILSLSGFTQYHSIITL